MNNLIFINYYSVVVAYTMETMGVSHDEISHLNHKELYSTICEKIKNDMNISCIHQYVNEYLFELICERFSHSFNITSDMFNSCQLSFHQFVVESLLHKYDKTYEFLKASPNLNEKVVKLIKDKENINVSCLLSGEQFVCLLNEYLDDFKDYSLRQYKRMNAIMSVFHLIDEKTLLPDLGTLYPYIQRVQMEMQTKLVIPENPKFYFSALDLMNFEYDIERKTLTVLNDVICISDVSVDDLYTCIDYVFMLYDKTEIKRCAYSLLKLMANNYEVVRYSI